MKQLAGREEELVLVRNHERGNGAPFGPALTPTYGTTASGGTTNLRFRRGAWIADQASLTGTIRNCAGGPTPWGSWLTCEETTQTGLLAHGYVFEVPAEGAASAVPITDLGRMSHEAAAVEPVSGYVYETEDTGSCGFYRMIPNDTSGQPGSLEAGGTLQMCQVLDSGGTPIGNLSDPLQGEVFDVTWVDVDPASPYSDGKTKGATTFRRGVVFCYRPPASDPTLDGELEAFFVGDSSAESSGPDNVTVSPHGGLLLCEDGGSNPERLMGLSADGCSYVFCENNVELSAGDIAGAGKNVSAGNYRGSEFAGACFDPESRYLFVNVQSPGITFAISGPWHLGGGAHGPGRGRGGLERSLRAPHRPGLPRRLPGVVGGRDAGGGSVRESLARDVVDVQVSGGNGTAEIGFAAVESAFALGLAPGVSPTGASDWKLATPTPGASFGITLTPLPEPGPPAAAAPVLLLALLARRAGRRNARRR